MSDRLVYFIEDFTTGLTKIGATTNLEKRLKSLQFSNRKLIVLHTFSCANHYALEHELHRHFKQYRRQPRTFRHFPTCEWFALPTDWWEQATLIFGDGVNSFIERERRKEKIRQQRDFYIDAGTRETEDKARCPGYLKRRGHQAPVTPYITPYNKFKRDFAQHFFSSMMRLLSETDYEKATRHLAERSQPTFGITAWENRSSHYRLP